MAFSLSDPKTQKIILVVLALLGLGYGYYLYIYTPRKESLDQKAAELSRLESNLKTAKMVVAASDTLLLVDELKKRGEELKLVESLIPTSEQLPNLLEEVSRTGERTGVRFALFEPRPPVQHEIYQERPYMVTLRGGYHQTAMFLADVATLPQIIKPSGLSLIREKGEEVTEGQTLTAKLTLTTYVMIGSPQAPKKESK